MRHIAPAHGFLMARPEVVIDHLITHRLSREHKMVRALEEIAPASLKDLTAKAYDHLPPSMLALATRSALAHLLKLEAEHRVHRKGERWHLHHQH